MTAIEAAELERGDVVYHPAWTRPMYVHTASLESLALAEAGAKGPTMCVNFREGWGRRVLALLSTEPAKKRVK